jgi:hypothetical protein
MLRGPGLPLVVTCAQCRKQVLEVDRIGEEEECLLRDHLLTVHPNAVAPGREVPMNGSGRTCHWRRSSARGWSCVAHSPRPPAPASGNPPGTTLATGPVAMSHDSRPRSEVAVARRYLDHGFLDVAMRIFGRNVAQVRSDDWRLLVDRLLDRGRVAEAVETCRMGGVPLPRRELLALGDHRLHCKDVDAAIHYYELAQADHERWTDIVDLLTRLPARELQAIAVAERHLLGRHASVAPLRVAVSA